MDNRNRAYRRRRRCSLNSNSQLRSVVNGNVCDRRCHVRSPTGRPTTSLRQSLPVIQSTGRRRQDTTLVLYFGNSCPAKLLSNYTSRPTTNFVDISECSDLQKPKTRSTVTCQVTNVYRSTLTLAGKLAKEEAAVNN